MITVVVIFFITMSTNMIHGSSPGARCGIPILISAIYFNLQLHNALLCGNIMYLCMHGGHYEARGLQYITTAITVHACVPS
jgi:hypothetical protein